MFLCIRKYYSDAKGMKEHFSLSLRSFLSIVPWVSVQRKHKSIFNP